MSDRNLTLPGNPRYQPKALQEILGYDNLFHWVARVEFATLETLAEIGLIPEAEIALLTEEVKADVMNLTTTEIYDYERKVTKHDIRAWIELAKERMDPRLARWLHVPLTSYDPLDSGRIAMYLSAYQQVIRPSILKVIESLCESVEEYADELQIGRTHGQHALPITVGFWFATILNRVVYNYQELDRAAGMLVGKITGAVGASNAVRGLGIAELCGDQPFEQRVLKKLGLDPAPISTQILPPEPLAYFLHATVMLSTSLGQFGRDARHLMRSEIGELAEPFSNEQSGSSAMPHKRNPISFEGLEAAATKNVVELQKVMLTLISEHQRDLVASAVMRDFPVILVNLQTQLDTLSRTDEAGVPMIRRIRIFPDALRRNFDFSANVIVAEPLHITLQMAGYQGDAHRLVNHRLVVEAWKSQRSLMDVLGDVAEEDEEVATAIAAIPAEVIQLLAHPDRYTGDAAERARSIAQSSRESCGLAQVPAA
jgi:adenylosuccinate lyase